MQHWSVESTLLGYCRIDMQRIAITVQAVQHRLLGEGRKIEDSIRHAIRNGLHRCADRLVHAAIAARTAQNVNLFYSRDGPAIFSVNQLPLILHQDWLPGSLDRKSTRLNSSH